MCGLCCISVYELDKYYVEVEPEELPRLPKEFVRKFVGPEFGRHAIKAIRATMRKGPLSGLTFKVCAALDGNPLVEAKCSIYKHRPDACKDFPRGGHCCTRIRRETLAALMRGKPEEVEGCLRRKPGR
jgi:Fe-S-cluster containining protein